MYFASVVDNETHFCNFDYHDIPPPTNVNKYLEVDFLLSKSPIISESVYLQEMVLILQSLDIPLRFLWDIWRSILPLPNVSY